MAYDLVARLRIQDEMSAKIRKAAQTTDGLKRAVDGVNSSTSRLGRAAGTAGGGFVKLGGAAGRTLSDIASKAAKASLAIGGIGAAVVGAGAVAGIVKLSSTALKLSSDAEQASIAFETMLGSADKSQQFLADLTQFANKTPFELPGLRDSAKKMLAFQFAADDVIPTLTAVGNAASGLGLGADGIDRITIALGQMKAKGRVQGDELLQLTEAGIPAMDILAKKMNVTTAAVLKMSEKGLIPADKAIKSLVEGMNQRFPNMMEKQSKSLAGLYSTMKDVFNNGIIKKWGDGLASTLKPRFDALVTWINANGATIDRWGQRLQAAAGAASDAIARKFEGAFSYVKSHYFDNPEFTKIPDISGKVEYIIQDIKKTYDEWYAAGGDKQIESVAKSVSEFLGTLLGGATQPMLDAGAKLGKAAGQGILEGLQGILAEHPLITMLAGAAIGGRFGGVWGAVAGFVGGAGVSAYSQYNETKAGKTDGKVFADPKLQKLAEAAAAYEKANSGAPTPAGSRLPDTGIDGSNAGGLSRVPYNGYVSVLHKDEGVLTKAENERYSNGRASNGPINLTINVNGGAPEASQMRKYAAVIADEIATQLNAIGTVMAG